MHELNRSAVKFMFDGAEVRRRRPAAPPPDPVVYLEMRDCFDRGQVRDVQTPLELDMEADDENMLEVCASLACFMSAARDRRFDRLRHRRLASRTNEFVHAPLSAEV